MTSRVAIIDLGTNTFHLLIADVSASRPRFLHRERRPVKIGQGGINDGQILDDAINRAVACMVDFRQRIDTYAVDRTLAFGTSALRSAANGLEVAARIKDSSGIDVRLISGEEEAQLIYTGVASALDLGPDPSLIVDIGGGSVEFIIGNRSGILWKHSFDIGAQRLLEKFQKHDPILASEVSALDLHFQEHLRLLESAMKQFPVATLVGSSGTFDTLSEIYCIQQGIPFSDEQSETPLTVDAFYTIYEMLISRNRAQRMQIPGMIEMRVDMIVVASCLVRFLLEKFQIKHVRVSSYSLKEGILAALTRGEW